MFVRVAQTQLSTWSHADEDEVTIGCPGHPVHRCERVGGGFRCCAVAAGHAVGVVRAGGCTCSTRPLRPGQHVASVLGAGTSTCSPPSWIVVVCSTAASGRRGMVGSRCHQVDPAQLAMGRGRPAPPTAEIRYVTLPSSRAGHVRDHDQTLSLLTSYELQMLAQRRRPFYQPSAVALHLQQRHRRLRVRLRRGAVLSLCDRTGCRSYMALFAWPGAPPRLEGGR